MGKIEQFEDIEAWKKAREFTRDIYQITGTNEFARDFGLRDQLRRAAISVMSNIAEGFERDGNKEFQQFLYLAKGSCGEIRAQLYIALDQGYIAHDDFVKLATKALEINRMLAGFITYLQRSELHGRKFKKA
jgi:four helix bundle protein